MSQKVKPHILFTIPTLRMGGSERVLVNLANHWAKQKKFSITILSHDDPQNEPFYAVYSSIRVLKTGCWKKGKKWRIPSHVRRSIRDLNPDLIVSFIVSNSMLTFLGSLFSGVPLIACERSDPQVIQNPLVKFLRNLFYRFSSHITAQTDRAKASFPPYVRSKTTVIPNPIVLGDVRRGAPSKTIIAAGRLSKEKNYASLIRAFRLVAQKNPEWNLVIWGEGPERKRLESIIKEEHLESRVSLPGRTKNLAEEMSKAGIFVLSSHFEGMPNALCEAMAIGLPVVSTDCPTGPRELIAAGEDGIMVPVDDVSEMAGAMVRLIADENYRAKLGKNAAQKMKQHNIENIAPLWEKIFLEALQR